MTAAAVCTTRSSWATAASRRRERGRPRPAAARHDLRRPPTSERACCDEAGRHRDLHAIATSGRRRHRDDHDRPVAPATSATITNTVTVDPTNAIFETDETNNIAVESDHRRYWHRPDDRQDRRANDPTLRQFIATGLRPDRDERHADLHDHRRQHRSAGRDQHPRPRRAARRDDLPAARHAPINGFTCTHNAGVVECIGGPILGTQGELPPGIGPDDATIIIKVFAIPNVGSCTTRCASIRSTRSRRTTRTTTSSSRTPWSHRRLADGAFNELTITKTQKSPRTPSRRAAS